MKCVLRITNWKSIVVASYESNLIIQNNFKCLYLYVGNAECEELGQHSI